MPDARRQIITRDDVLSAGRQLHLTADAIVTPSARETAEARGVALIIDPVPPTDLPELDEAHTGGGPDESRGLSGASGTESLSQSVEETPPLANLIDHTNLSPTATAAEISTLCAEAIAHNFAAVCVAPNRVAQAARELAERAIAVCGVVGFPTGAHQTAIKTAEARQCVADGATEIDMVAAVGLLRDGDMRAYHDDIAAVRQAIGDLTLKVIIEAALLDESEIVHAAIVAAEAGADFVKTSTGVYSKARLEDVVLLRRVLPPAVRIKAAGGIRSAAEARAFVEAGADRIGTSASVAIMWEAPPSTKKP